MFLNDDDEDWLILAASRFFVMYLEKEENLSATNLPATKRDIYGYGPVRTQF